MPRTTENLKENGVYRARRGSFSGLQRESMMSIQTAGKVLLAVTWVVSTISIGVVCNVIKFDFKVDQDLGMSNYALYVFYLNFVILWIWCLISWISMKLFRHSKGSG